MSISLVMPCQKDRMRLFFAEKIMNATRHPEVIDEAQFYGLQEDVIYLAEAFCDAFMSQSSESFLAEKAIHFLTNKEDETGVSPNDAIGARVMADRIAIGLATWGSFPKGYSIISGELFGTRMYRLASVAYPEESLRPILLTLSLDFPAWARVLPYVRREISMII